jgi:putative FmdB family regulatory protein
LEGHVPIYEYRCSSCGFQKEYLQKISDPLLSSCPECGKEAFKKMLTAAGFQLKGTGWYASDFKGNGSRPTKEKTQSAKADSGKTDSGNTDSAKADSTKTEAPVSTASPGAASPVAESGS